jgi:hypothetical protein
VARHWFADEYVPVAELLSHGELRAPDETETDAYMRVAADRYRVLRTHEWSEEVLDELRRSDVKRRRRRRTPPRSTRHRRWL